MLLLVLVSAVLGDVVLLKDGGRLVGSVQRQAESVVLLTPSGELSIPGDAVASTRRRADLLPVVHQMRALGQDAPHQVLGVARWCLDHGLYEEFLDAVDVLLGRAEHRAAGLELLASSRDAVLLDGLAPFQEYAPSQVRSLAQQAAGRSAARAAVAESWILRPRDAVPAAVVRGLEAAAQDSRPGVRGKALELLAAVGGDAVLDVLVKRSLAERTPELRQQAAAAALTYDHPNLVLPYAQALGSDSASLREAAYPVVEALADPRAIPSLIRLLRPAPGGGDGQPPRAFISVEEQISFLQDFEVEIAQGAVIADPVIGVLRQGTVLDVKATAHVVTAVEKQVVVGLLTRLSGRDFGTDFEAWRSWWNANGKELLERHFTEKLRQAG